MSQETKRRQELRELFIKKFDKSPNLLFLDECIKFDKAFKKSEQEKILSNIPDISEAIGQPFVEMDKWRRSDEGRKGRSIGGLKDISSSVWHPNSVFASVVGRVPIQKEESLDSHCPIM